jgi:DDE superfamily endonuclease
VSFVRTAGIQFFSEVELAVLYLIAAVVLLVKPTGLFGDAWWVGVDELIEAVGATLRYLPQYSPDLNPIEMVFHPLKAFLRKAAERTISGVARRIRAFIPTIHTDECMEYFRHAGYAPLWPESALNRQGYQEGRQPRYRDVGRPGNCTKRPAAATSSNELTLGLAKQEQRRPTPEARAMDTKAQGDRAVVPPRSMVNDWPRAQEERMKYVVRYEEAGETVSLFDAPSLLEAVRLKQQVEECYNKMHRCNRIFSVREATAADIQEFKQAGIVVLRPGRWSIW